MRNVSLRRGPIVVALGVFVCSLLLSACSSSETSTLALRAVPTATQAYRAPVVVTATPTASPTPPPVSSPTAVPTLAVASHPVPAPPTVPPPPGPDPIGGVPGISGQLILVSLTQQWLWAYQDRQLLYDTPVTTGMPELATPSGIYNVQFKVTNITFISPWPQGSPYYYAPEHIDYALYFLDDGYYIHDAPWRHQFGPGTNYPHTDADGTQETGSHGCVNVPFGAGAWLYQWARPGAVVDIVGTTPTAPPPTPVPPTPTAVPTTPTPTPVPPTPTPTPVPPTPTSTP